MSFRHILPRHVIFAQPAPDLLHIIRIDGLVLEIKSAAESFSNEEADNIPQRATVS